MIAIANDKYRPGAASQLWIDPFDEHPYQARPVHEGLRIEFGVDAHFVTYVVRREGKPVVRQPRIKKEHLADVRAHGFEILHYVNVADVDTPGHKPLTTEQIQDARLKLANLPTVGWYTSRAGFRILQPLTTPRTPEQYEASLPSWLDELQRVLGDAWVVDYKCCDWTRHFRMPFVVRDRKYTKPFIDTSRMVAVDLPVVEVAPESAVPAAAPAIVFDSNAASDNLSKAARYVSRIAAPACGHGLCDSTLWNVCLHVVRGFAVPEDAACPLVSQWAASSSHGWTETQVRRKVADAGRAHAALGFHLRADDDEDVPLDGAPGMAVEQYDDPDLAAYVEVQEHHDDEMPAEVDVPPEPPSWRRLLLRKPRGGLRPCHANVEIYLRNHPAWQNRIAFDEFANTTIWSDRPPWTTQYPETAKVQPGDPWTDEDTTRLIATMNLIGLDVGKDVVRDALRVFAREHVVHPVRDYLDTLVWDGTSRLDRWLHRYLGAEDNEYNRKAGRWWMIQAVRRIYKPGSLAKYILTIEGPQDLGKSLALRTIATPKWFADGRIDIGNKEGAMTLQGVWIYELAEGELLNRASKEALKQYIGQPFDHYVPKWSNLPVNVPRQTVFAMTVNEAQYLTDPTGNVRFWPVLATLIDIAGIESDRDQLWAEAVAAFKAGEIPEPRSGEDRELFAEVVKDRVQVDPWEAEIEAKLVGLTETWVEYVLTDVLAITAKQQERKDQFRVAGILRKLGFKQAPGRPLREGKRVRLYVRDEADAAATVEPLPLVLAEEHAWLALRVLGWTEAVLHDGRRVWTQPEPQDDAVILDFESFGV